MTDDSSFRKITFNAHEGTCAWFEGRYGYGWSTQLRELMDRHMIDTNRSEAEANRTARHFQRVRTLGDFGHD